ATAVPTLYVYPTLVRSVLQSSYGSCYKEEFAGSIWNSFTSYPVINYLRSIRNPDLTYRSCRIELYRMHSDYIGTDLLHSPGREYFHQSLLHCSCRIDK